MVQRSTEGESMKTCLVLLTFVIVGCTHSPIKTSFPEAPPSLLQDVGTLKTIKPTDTYKDVK